MMNGIFGFSGPSIPFGPSTETVESGGGVATPVAEDFSKFLQTILSGGGGGGTVNRPGGRSPEDQTVGIMESLNQLIAGPDVSGQQSAVQQIIQQDTERQNANLRERFTAGGGSRGTPSAVAEALFRSNVTPRIAAATGQLDLQANQQKMQALFQLLNIIGGFSGRGVAQAKTDVIVNPGPLSDIAGIAQGVGKTASAI